MHVVSDEGSSRQSRGESRRCRSVAEAGVEAANAQDRRHILGGETAREHASARRGDDAGDDAWVIARKLVDAESRLYACRPSAFSPTGENAIR